MEYALTGIPSPEFTSEPMEIPQTTNCSNERPKLKKAPRTGDHQRELCQSQQYHHVERPTPMRDRHWIWWRWREWEDAIDC